jgi:hypothetical protein
MVGLLPTMMRRTVEDAGETAVRARRAVLIELSSKPAKM